MTTTSSQSMQTRVRTIDSLSVRYAESEPRHDHALRLVTEVQMLEGSSLLR
jgi:hypothetical protein